MKLNLNASVVGMNKTKLDNSTSSSEIEIEGYDLFRVDKSPRGGGEDCHIEKNFSIQLQT